MNYELLGNIRQDVDIKPILKKLRRASEPPEFFNGETHYI